MKTGKKCKNLLIIFLLAIILCSCSSKEDEMVDVNGWRDKLVNVGPLIDTNQIKQDANNTAEMLSTTASAGYDKAVELGNGAAAMLRDWISSSAGSSVQLPEGTTQTTDQPLTNGRIKAPLLYTVDGDTIAVQYSGEEVRVRLIGINTPESVASEEYLDKTGKENTEEGKQASAFLKEYVSDTEYVYLEFDEILNDDYGRLLAYVWLTETGKDVETQMLNGIMLTKGYAELMIIAPNTKYETELKAITE